MRVHCIARCAAPIVLAAVLVFVPSLVMAARSQSGPIKAKPQGEVVEMFAGIKSGDIEVTFIPKDAHEATILFKNKTGKPVAIALPEAFAGVPVLAQFGPPGGIGNRGIGNQGVGGPGGIGNQGGITGTQGVGGGFQPGGFQPGGGPGGNIGGPGIGFPGGFMNVGPDKTGKVKVNTVCLEHGKPDPNPHTKYEIRPIESFTQNASVIELCKMIGRGEVSQNTAQAAAWHLANDISFDKLARKNRIEHLNGRTEKFFSAQELKSAAFWVDQAKERAELAPQETLATASSQIRK